MPKLKLTDRIVKGKRVTVDGKTITLPPRKGIVELWDTIIPGLALRIGYGGKRTYTVTTRINGDQVRRPAGTTVTASLAQARDKARDILSEAGEGRDTYSKRTIQLTADREKQEAARADAGTFQAVAAEWLTDTLKNGGAKLRSKNEIERRLERVVFPAFGALPIGEITKADVSALIGSIARKYPIAANRTLGDIRRVFHWAVSNDRIETSPTIGIEPPGEEKSRDRTLADDEIRRLWTAFGELGYPFGHVFKLLLLTGARRNEVGAVKWSEIDGDTWVLPSERAKNGKQHLWPLSTVAQAILDATPHVDDSEYVFPAQMKGRDAKGERTIDKPVTGWGAIKTRIDKMVAQAAADKAGEPLDMEKHGLARWTLHDLRRTLVTEMNETLEIEPHIIEAVIGHVSGSAKRGVAGVYNRAQYLPQRKAALERWAQHIEGIEEGQSGNVEQMKRRKQRAS